MDWAAVGGVSPSGRKALRWGVQKCENTMILFWGKNSALHPEIRWLIILVLVLQYLHFRVHSIMQDISLKISSEEALILCGDNKPFSLCLKVYLCYKTITSQNMSSEAQIKNFFIS